MKHILVKAPALAALFVVACAGSQKNLSEPQKAAMAAEDHAQKAQDEAQKARAEANKSQEELNEAQAANDQAQRAQADADRRAQQASHAAGRAEQQAAAAAAPPPAPAEAPPPAAPPAPPPKGVTESQGANAPAPGKIVVVTSALLFPSGSAEIGAGAKPKLDEVVTALKKQPQPSNVVVQGFTDDTGSKAGNMRLSEERAQAVSDYLSSQGIPKDHITTKGLGPQDPISTKNSVEGRAVNRRVDIVIQPAQGIAQPQGQGPQGQGPQGGPQGHQQGQTNPSP
jgi:outer membrane protein OmpA-like peptidoglycan-associated protein